MKCLLHSVKTNLYIILISRYNTNNIYPDNALVETPDDIIIDAYLLK